MKIFALETSVEEIRKRLLVPGENEILTTPYHFIVFLFPALFYTAVGAAAFVVIWVISDFTENVWVATGLFSLWGIIYFYFISAAYINWQYDFIIITSDKLVLVDHHSFFYQYINPIHLQNIQGVEFESQYLGFFNCGILHIHQAKEGMMEHRDLYYVPNQAAVAGLIENAFSQFKLKETGKPVEPTKEQLADMKERVAPDPT